MALSVIVGPAVGGLTGVLLGYVMVERIAAGAIKTTIPPILIVAGC
jgi:uncharacterized protein YaaW (UPF0174 family)